jgi:hypothetical protein
MAVRYWQGTTGDWQTAANWSGSTVPVDGDEVIFDGRVTQSVTEGMLDSETGATGSGDLDLLHIKSSYAGDIGSATEPLATHADKIIVEGSGTYYLLAAKDNQTTTAIVNEIYVNRKEATVYLYSNANNATRTCRYSNGFFTAGTIYVAYYTADVTDCGGCVTTIYVVPKDNWQANVTLYIEKDGYFQGWPTGSAIHMLNGLVTCDAYIHDLYQYGGRFYFGSEAKLGTVVEETDLNIEELYLYDGQFFWYPDDTDGDAYIDEVRHYGGIFDASGTYSRDRAKTLGKPTVASEIYVYPGAVMKLNNGMGNITIASNSQFFNMGGSIVWDNYTELGVSYDQP